VTEIYVDRDNMSARIAELIARVDETEKALGDRPAMPDGGIASAMIGFIAQSGIEAVGLSDDLMRALGAVAEDVLADITLTDAEMGDQLGEFRDELEG
jgi:hypothetical protein